MSKQDNKDYHRKPVGEWLLSPIEWRIPVYQRHYAWRSDPESGPIRLFWNTVVKQTRMRLDSKKPKQHYLGAVILDNKAEEGAIGDLTCYDVVDGQQRLTTIQVALLALAKVARDVHHYGEFWKETLEGYVVYEGKPRLTPTNFDNRQFQRVLFEASGDLFDLGEQDVLKENALKSKVMATCHYFEGAINSIVEELPQHDARKVIDAIFDTLTKGFDLVIIRLGKDDDARGIFESLNSYAEPLTTFDLIRNYVFRRAARDEHRLDEQLFKSPEWQRIELPYWEENADRSGTTHIQAYIARMLVAALKREVLSNKSEIFRAYKEFSRKFHTSPESEKPSERYRKEVEGLARYAGVYCHLDSGLERHSLLSGVDCGVFSHSIWKDRALYPVIFSIAGSGQSKEEKAKMMKLLESYVIRRGVCGLSPKGYNKHAVTLCDALGDSPNCEKLLEALKGKTAQPDTTVFPDNDRVKKGCVETKFYGSVFQHYVFKQLELFTEPDAAERGDFEVQSIDHILPQSWDNDPGWPEMDPLLVETHVHTIGNLAPMSTKRNAKKSNYPWEQIKGLLAESPMSLNRALAKHETWGINQIRARSEELAEKICKIWPDKIS